MARLSVKIDMGNRAKLGPGKVQLLELIDRHGSIRSAANAMDMSYRRAWLLLKETEALMGAPVIVAETGGSKGGGATLTPLGRAVTEKYRAIEKRASASVAAELRALIGLARNRKIHS